MLSCYYMFYLQGILVFKYLLIKLLIVKEQLIHKTTLLGFYGLVHESYFDSYDC